MSEVQQTVKTPHSASITNREELKLSGVREVLGYDEQFITALCDCGEVTISGNGLKILGFDSKQGLLQASGRVVSLVYTEKKEKTGSLFSRFVR